jgi:hypothetical protein
VIDDDAGEVCEWPRFCSSDDVLVVVWIQLLVSDQTFFFFFYVFGRIV